MLMPVYGFLEGDTLGLLVLSQDTDTVAEVIDKVRTSARSRVPEREDLQLRHNGIILSNDQKLASAGVGLLDRVDVIVKNSAGEAK